MTDEFSKAQLRMMAYLDSFADFIIRDELPVYEDYVLVTRSMSHYTMDVESDGRLHIKFYANSSGFNSVWVSID